MQIKCYKYQDAYSPIQNAITYIETLDGSVLRQITVNTNECIASNLYHPKWGLVLAEGYVDYDSIAEVELITENDFEEIWSRALKENQRAWEETKSSYPVGSYLIGKIAIFYPQGIIIRIGDNALGVTNYKECKSAIGPEKMYPNHKIEAIVSGYNEKFNWLELSNPKGIE